MRRNNMALTADSDICRYMKKNGFRLTKGRKALLEIVKNEHLTFKQIQSRLAERGYTNVASVYNMIDFFVDNKILTEVFINGVKYYDLSLGNDMHSDDSYIHMAIDGSDDIIEISNKTLYDRITEVVERDYNVSINNIKIVISAKRNNRY